MELLLNTSRGSVGVLALKNIFVEVDSSFENNIDASVQTTIPKDLQISNKNKMRH
jgi:hypothetical protein